jgi:hypothetical protein
VGHVACMIAMRSAFTILVGKSEGKRPLGRARRRWEGVDWIHLAQDRDQWRVLVNMVANLRVP